MAYDLVIKNGVVIDGSGLPHFRADVGIQDGLITEVGSIDEGTRRVIDADGLIVAPGLVDAHTHYDAQLTWDPLATSSCFHGVTTVVGGNCGYTVAPCRPALQAGLPWNWETYPEYLDALDGRLGVNFAGYVGHTAVRRYVMGEAAGFSTSLAPTQVGYYNEPIPSRRATDEEVYALAEVIKEFNVGNIAILPRSVLQGINEEDRAPLVRLVRETGRPVVAQGSLLSELAAGARVGIFGFGGGRRFNRPFTLKRTSIFNGLPTWRRVLALDHAEKVRQLRDERLKRNPMSQRFTVISADSHVNIPETAFAEYFPAHLKERAPRVERGADRDTVVFEGKRIGVWLMNAVAGMRYEDFKAHATRLGEGAVGGYDPEERLKDMDLDGVDAEVLFGSVGNDYRDQTEDPALKLALTRAYNDWLADFCKAAPERLIGIAEMPYWDLEQTLAEAKRAKEKGLRGILLHAIPLDHNYTEPYWEPLWSLAEDLDLPVHWHLGPRPLTPGLANNRFISISCNKAMMAEPITSVIFGGVLARHPKLRVVAVEGGAGWAAFLVPHIDNVWRRHRHWQDSPLAEPPSTYFRRQVKLTFIEDPAAVLGRHLIGLDCLMWSSDYPHADSTWPHSQEVLGKHLAGVPEAEAAQIAGGNAARLYGLKVAAPAAGTLG